MLKIITVMAVFFQMFTAFAQTKPFVEIRCQSQRIALRLDFKACRSVNLLSLCKTSVVIDNRATLSSELEVGFKKLSANENVSLLLSTAASDRTKIDFKGPYVRHGIFSRNGNFMGDFSIHSQALNLREKMICKIIEE